MYEVTIYTDGACSGNPGPAGIGVVLICGNRRKEISRYIGEATNNRAELQAVIEGLAALKHPEQTRVTLHTDSQLVSGVLAHNWKAKANLDLVSKMRELAEKCASLLVVKVRGHSGNPLNERADTLARNALEKGNF